MPLETTVFFFPAKVLKLALQLIKMRAEYILLQIWVNKFNVIVKSTFNLCAQIYISAEDFSAIFFLYVFIFSVSFLPFNHQLSLQQCRQCHILLAVLVSDILTQHFQLLHFFSPEFWESFSSSWNFHGC